MKQIRDKKMDVAKGIGILTIIAAHVGMGNLGKLFYTFHLPLFFVVSGYFFKYERNWIHYISKKAKAYLIPYTSCAIIIMVFQFFNKGMKKDIVANSFMKFLIQKRYTALWFLATLLLVLVFF